MGGIIVIDFIDMVNENKENYSIIFRNVMESDKAKHKILHQVKLV